MHIGMMKLLGAFGLLVEGLVALPATVGATEQATRSNTPLGALLATLDDPAATNALFGSSVAVSGTTAVIGASGTKNGSGTAYIYVKGASGWPTKPSATLSDPAATADDSFGYSVAVSGTTVVIGADGAKNGSGTAYIYVKGASGWPTKPTETLHDPAATSDDSFGGSVAVSGKTAVIGAEGAKSPRWGGLHLRERRFGLADETDRHAASTGGNLRRLLRLLGGGVWDDRRTGGAGTKSPAVAAYIYVKGALGWPTKPTATLSDPSGGETFGYSVAVSGTTAAVGAYGTNSAAGRPTFMRRALRVGRRSRPPSCIPGGDRIRLLRLLGGGFGYDRRDRRRRHQVERRGGLHLREGRFGLADEADRHAVGPAGDRIRLLRVVGGGVGYNRRDRRLRHQVLRRAAYIYERALGLADEAERHPEASGRRGHQ